MSGLVHSNTVVDDNWKVINLVFCLFFFFNTHLYAFYYFFVVDARDALNSLILCLRLTASL